jgi:uncharacterized membrane protein YeaQ/YmgE (transglycosylase-associated protein family)
MNILIFLLVGLISGWLAGMLMKGRGFGPLIDIIVGIMGAIIGGYVFSLFGVRLGGGLLGEVIMSVIGALILLAIVKAMKRI